MAYTVFDYRLGPSKGLVVHEGTFHPACADTVEKPVNRKSAAMKENWRKRRERESAAKEK